MPAKPRQCWYCDHFFHTIPGTNQGQCRRFAPSGVDTNFESATVDTTDAFGGDIAFPFIYEATEEWCGDFKVKPGTVPDPS
jgi:hypothetical protein